MPQGAEPTTTMAYARRVALDFRQERHRREKHFGPPPPTEQRVRISGFRPELNGKHGMAGPLDAVSGTRRVVIEGMGGAAYAIKPANIALAARAPAESEYNAGAAAFQLKRYGNNTLPKRCKAGSGTPAYSTQRPAETPIPPPVAGSLLPRKDPPAQFHESWVAGSLPVRVAGDLRGELRWFDPLTGAEVSRQKVDARRWLPVLIDGLRASETTGGAYVALRGAIELADAAASAGALPALMPTVVPALKAAIDMRERSVVCVALRLLMVLLNADERAGLALRPHYRFLLPTLAAFQLARQPNLSDEIERSQNRRINVADLVEEALALMERKGGPGASALVKSYCPSFHAETEVLHRGFR